ncbi:MAG: DUF3179 domain-containing (seleno)protein [Sphingomonadales bacterium]
MVALAAGWLTLATPMATAQSYMPPAKTSFVPLELAGHVGGLEPVLMVPSQTVTKIYPLRILAFHGVINDELAGIDLALTYCGPCGTVGAFRTNGVAIRAQLESEEPIMTLVGPDGQTWSQEDGEPLTGRAGMLKAVPATVVSMARARQAAVETDVVLVLQDTAASRVPTPKTLALPGQRDLVATPEDAAGANTTKVLDARSWSLDVLAPERRLTGEDRLILLEKPQSGVQGPPAPR